jgi:DNA-directed RNA polymerase I subunit RPA12
MADKRLVVDSIGGNLFCGHCGSFLEIPAREPLQCSNCGASCLLNESSASDPLETRTKARAAPAWASGRAELSVKRKSTRATVEQECPACGHGILEFYTMQMRSVDEGQTVFYECLECGHRFSQNN